MARLRFLLAAVLAAAALAVIAVPASASVPTASTSKFCADVRGLTSKFNAAKAQSGTSPTKAFGAIESQLRKAAKDAPTRVKSATSKLAGIYGSIASGDTEALSKLTDTNFTKAITTFSTYVGLNCSGT
jgi:hypothetical protein